MKSKYQHFVSKGISPLFLRTKELQLAPMGPLRRSQVNTETSFRWEAQVCQLPGDGSSSRHSLSLLEITEFVLLPVGIQA